MHFDWIYITYNNNKKMNRKSKKSLREYIYFFIGLYVLWVLNIY